MTKKEEKEIKLDLGFDINDINSDTQDNTKMEDDYLKTFNEGNSDDVLLQKLKETIQEQLSPEMLMKLVSTLDKPKTKMTEIKKINTNIPEELWQQFNLYSLSKGIKKKELFTQMVQEFMDKYKDSNVELQMKIGTKKINIQLENKEKKVVNFEVPKDLFPEMRVFSESKNLKMYELYEQSIIHFLNKVGYKIKNV